MPIFEYKCSKCGTEFEALVRDGEKPKCPKCGGKRLRKLVSSFSTSRSPKSCGGSSACSHGDCGGGHCCGGHGHGCRCGHCG